MYEPASDCPTRVPRYVQSYASARASHGPGPQAKGIPRLSKGEQKGIPRTIASAYAKAKADSKRVSPGPIGRDYHQDKADSQSL